MALFVCHLSFGQIMYHDLRRSPQNQLAVALFVRHFLFLVCHLSFVMGLHWILMSDHAPWSEKFTSKPTSCGTVCLSFLVSHLSHVISSYSCLLLYKTFAISTFSHERIQTKKNLFAQQQVYNTIFKWHCPRKWSWRHVWGRRAWLAFKFCFTSETSR
jgi:hypothetical protein